MFFWIIIAGILALTLFLVWQSWSSNLGSSITAEQSELSIYNARVDEITRDLESGKLDVEMADAAKAEEARKLLKSQNSQVFGDEKSAPSSGWWMTLGLFSIPLCSVLIYLSLGTPPYLESGTIEPETAGQSMEQLVAAAERRLETNPDDLQGWQVLVPVYLRQQDYEKAEIAFQNIIRIDGEKTEVLSAYGEALVAKSQGSVSIEALTVFRKAVALDARNATARFFLGLFSFQNDDLDDARSIWQSMIDDAQGDEEWLPVMKKRVADLDSGVSESGNESRAQEIANLPEDEQRAQILSMVGRLAARLEENPDDQSGWIRLVTAYMVLGNKEEAEEALQSALDAFPNSSAFEAQLQKIVATTKGAGN